MAPKASAAKNGKARSGNTAKNEKDDETEMPKILKFWRTLYRSLPHTGSFDVSLTICTVLFLSFLRVVIFQNILTHVFDWPSAAETASVTKNAAASMISIFHSVNLVPALVVAFSVQGYLPYSQRLDAASQAWQDAVTALLQFCTGYMVYDGIFIILEGIYDEDGLDGADYMFLGHHLATSLYMSSTRIIGAGHMSAMMCMFLGELTNPLQNSFYIAGYAMTLDNHGPTTETMHFWIELVFSVAYFIMRSFIGPAVCLHMTFDLWKNGRKTIPIIFLCIWSFLIWAVIIGSIPWIQSSWDVMVKFYNSHILPAMGAPSSQEL